MIERIKKWWNAGQVEQAAEAGEDSAVADEMAEGMSDLLAAHEELAQARQLASDTQIKMGQVGVHIEDAQARIAAQYNKRLAIARGDRSGRASRE